VFIRPKVPLGLHSSGSHQLTLRQHNPDIASLASPAYPSSRSFITPDILQKGIVSRFLPAGKLSRLRCTENIPGFQ